MASGGIFGALGKSRAQRFYLKGSLFFLLLHMFHGTTEPTSTPISHADSSSMTTPAETSNSENTVPYMTSAPSEMTSYTTNDTTLSHHMPTDWTDTPSSGSNTSVSASNVRYNADCEYKASTPSQGGLSDRLSCPEFTCTTDCYAKFMKVSPTQCPSTSAYCELIKHAMSYSIMCSVSCGMSCGNDTVTNCSLACCNTTDCLNASLSSRFGSLSTAAPMTPSSASTVVKVTVPPTPANNGKKCISIKCDGAACYKNTNSIPLVFCPVGQDYCKLHKVTVGTVESWQGSCSEDCRKAQVCSSGLSTCHQECCNATAAASCLKLTGELNMHSSATRGPQSPALLTASLLLLWMVKSLT